jgi:hypothetical protein
VGFQNVLSDLDTAFRQRRTDFSGIVGAVERLLMNGGKTVNEGRISQVLWDRSQYDTLALNMRRQRRTDFSGIVGGNESVG